MLSLLHSPTLTPYMTTGKTIALTRQTLVGKVMSLLLNMLSRLVITFLPRSKRLLILAGIWDFPSGSRIKNPPAMQEHRRRSFDPWIGKIP